MGKSTALAGLLAAIPPYVWMSLLTILAALLAVAAVKMIKASE